MSQARRTLTIIKIANALFCLLVCSCMYLIYSEFVLIPYENQDLGIQIATEYNIPEDIAIELVNEARKDARLIRNVGMVEMKDGTKFDVQTGKIMEPKTYEYGSRSKTKWMATDQDYEYYQVYKDVWEFFR